MEKIDLELPDIFYDLLDQRMKADSVTSEILEEYVTLTKNAPTFFHELVNFFGVERTTEFVQLYGGITLNLPTPSDILNAVRKNNETE